MEPTPEPGGQDARDASEREAENAPAVAPGASGRATAPRDTLPLALGFGVAMATIQMGVLLLLFAC